MSINNPWENNFEIKNQNEIFENEKTETKIDVEDVLKFQEYKKDLEKIIPELQKIWLKVDEDWSLDFKNLKWYYNWPLIRWVDLHLYPNLNFNKKYKLWDKTWKITWKEKLAELFKFLGFSINENIFEKNSEDLNFLKSEIKKIIPELQNLWLEIDENWRLFFENLNYSWRKMKINWKTLRHFPNIDFLKKNWLTDEHWWMNSIELLKKFFIFLWFEIIDLTKEEDFKKYYKNLFEKENLIKKLKKVGLKITKEWKLDFSELRSNRDWPEIRWKELSILISSKLNQKYKIGNKTWTLSSKKDLENLFKFLWFSVNIDTSLDKEENQDLYFDDENYILEYENFNEIIDFPDLDIDYLSLKKEDF